MQDSDFKREFYSSQDVVGAYDAFRFKNKGGRFVHEEETKIAAQYWQTLDRSDSILDIPVGTGRVSSLLVEDGFEQIVGADFSPTMLAYCSSKIRGLNMLSCQDAFNLGFSDGAFSAVLSMRFIFHYEDSLSLLKEFRRILKDDGKLILDTTTWSPRTWTDYFNKRLGGSIYTHSKDEFTMLAKQAGFRVEASTEILMLPSFIYNFIPDVLMPLVKLIDKLYPKRFKTKRVWLLRPE